MADYTKENTKRDGKRRGFDMERGNRNASSTDKVTVEPLLRLTAYAFAGSFHSETLIEDEWGVESNAVIQLNRLCRWNLLEMIEAKASETLDLLNKGELSEHDALVVIVRESGGHTKVGNAFREGPGCPHLQLFRRNAQAPVTNAEPLGEYKVIQNRKGRSVVAVGARGDNLKKKNQESEKREAKVHRGPVHIYQVYLPDEQPKSPQRPYRGCCELCDPSLIRIHRGGKNNDLINAQI